jgi:toxin ParE1/3/4
VSNHIVTSRLPAFRRDVLRTLAWSEQQFGADAEVRYGRLLGQALRDVAANPMRPGTQARPELAPRAYVYHLRFSRDRTAGARVKTPRHFLLYRYRRGKIEFARLLHDSRDLSRHVPIAFFRE